MYVDTALLSTAMYEIKKKKVISSVFFAGRRFHQFQWICILSEPSTSAVSHNTEPSSRDRRKPSRLIDFQISSILVWYGLFLNP